MRTACGCQPLCTNTAASGDPARSSVQFFLDISAFYHAHRSGCLSEMLSPGTLDCETVGVSCIAMTIFTRPRTRRSVKRPAVLHGSPDEAALCLFNYKGDDQVVTIRGKTAWCPRM